METKKKNLLETATIRVLRPLAKLLLQHGLSYREFCELGKRVFFEAGKTILEEEGSKLNASQLSVLTGLHRKDVSAFLANEDKVTRLSTTSPGAAIIAEWISNPTYKGRGNQPRRLPYNSTNPNEPSFTNLVAQVSKDIRPKAYLDELIRLGVAEMNDDEQVELLKQAFIPSQDFEQKLGFFVHNVGDHMAAASANMLGEGETFLERSAFYDRLSQTDIALLKKTAEKKGMELLKHLYQQAEDQVTQRKGTKLPPANRRMTFGIYFYHTDEDKPDGSDS